VNTLHIKDKYFYCSNRSAKIDPKYRNQDYCYYLLSFDDDVDDDDDGDDDAQSVVDGSASNLFEKGCENPNIDMLNRIVDHMRDLFQIYSRFSFFFIDHYSRFDRNK